MTQDDDPKQRKEIARLGIFMTIPFVLAVPPIIGWFLGKWLDDLWQTTPFLAFLLLILGCVGGAREFYRIVKRYGNDDS